MSANESKSKGKISMAWEAIKQTKREWDDLQEKLSGKAQKCFGCGCNTDATLCSECYDTASECQDYEMLGIHEQNLALSSTQALLQELNLALKRLGAWQDYAYALENKVDLLKRDKKRLYARLHRK